MKVVSFFMSRTVDEDRDEALSENDNAFFIDFCLQIGTDFDTSSITASKEYFSHHL